MNQGARAGNAGLSCGCEDAGDDALHRLIQIGIVENDVRRFSSQLQGDALEAARGQLIDVLSGAVTARERNLGDIAVRNERLANFVAVSGDNIDHSGRKPRDTRKALQM